MKPPFVYVMDVDGDFDRVNREIEEIFFSSDNEFLYIVRKNYGDEKEFISRAMRAFDSAIDDYVAKKALMLSRKESETAEVIDIRPRLPGRVPVPAPSIWETTGLREFFYWSLASAAFVPIVILLLSSLAVHQSVNSWDFVNQSQMPLSASVNHVLSRNRWIVQGPPKLSKDNFRPTLSLHDVPRTFGAVAIPDSQLTFSKSTVMLPRHERFISKPWVKD